MKQIHSSLILGKLLEGRFCLRMVPVSCVCGGGIGLLEKVIYGVSLAERLCKAYKGGVMLNFDILWMHSLYICILITFVRNK